MPEDFPPFATVQNQFYAWRDSGLWTQILAVLVMAAHEAEGRQVSSTAVVVDMLAHHQSGLMNAAEFARALDVDAKTVASYLDLMVDLLLVSRLEPWHVNVGKRLVKSPRIYVRDSGILHALLGLATMEDVLGHPISSANWEGFVIEALLAAVPETTQANFYRTAAGAEIDLVLILRGGKLWAIEIKRSLTPKVERGFHHACLDLQPERRIVVYPGRERFPLKDDIKVSPLQALGAELLALHR